MGMSGDQALKRLDELEPKMQVMTEKFERLVVRIETIEEANPNTASRAPLSPPFSSVLRQAGLEPPKRK